MVDNNKKDIESGEHVEPCTRSSFQTRDIADAFSAEVLDEDTCRRLILETLHPSGAHCPGCGKPIRDETTLKNFWACDRATCKECGRWFTAVTSTFMQSARLNFKEIVLLALLAEFLESGIDIRDIANRVGVSPETVRHWIRRFDIYK